METPRQRSPLLWDFNFIRLRRFLLLHSVIINWNVTGLQRAEAATRYVDPKSANATAPYTDWSTAARSIQIAIDAADAGDEIVVTNGVYAAGGRVVFGQVLANRVTVTKPLIVRSVNGPAVTLIVGYQLPGTTNGNGAVRCAYVTNGALLSGFTLTNGATRATGDLIHELSGGGVWCESTNAVVSNCVIIANSGQYQGGGAYLGTLMNCLVTGNSAGSYGGGAFRSTVGNCMVLGNVATYGGGAYFGLARNSAFSGNMASLYGGGTYSGNSFNCSIAGNSAGTVGGGAYGGVLHNCIIYYNTVNSLDQNLYISSVDYSCTIPLPSAGAGNISNEPQLASASHLSAGSPCRQIGNATYSDGVDIDGDAWATPPSIGCDEYFSASLTGPLTVSIQTSSPQVIAIVPMQLTARISGAADSSQWNFGDGVIMSNRPYATHSWQTPGDYLVVLTAYNASNPQGVSATQMVHVLPAPVHYVAADSANPIPPYTNWGTAATRIQDAIDVAPIGAVVLITNGVYTQGGKPVGASLTNRVAVTKIMTVKSVNGPEVTVISGHQVPGTTNGDGAVRCAYLTNGAALIGFTLANGATRLSGSFRLVQSGGGAFCESNAYLRDCILTGNSANQQGGGAYGGTLEHCTLSQNAAGNQGGGAAFAELSNCILNSNTAADSGGGANSCDLRDCSLTNNVAGHYGGGTAAGSLVSCTLSGNMAGIAGGGGYGSGVTNCALLGNSAISQGGGSYGGFLNNCTILANSAGDAGGGALYAILSYCVITGNSGGQQGGGIYGGSANNCTISGNHAMAAGGGAFSASVTNCAITANFSSQDGGGVLGGYAINCTITGNNAKGDGGGASGAVLKNCIAYYNNAGGPNANCAASTLDNSCTTPFPSAGVGNVADEPLLADTFHLSAQSPCRAAGSADYTSGMDIDGELWSNPPSMGCDEIHAGSIVGPLNMAIQSPFTEVSVGFNVDFVPVISGHASSNVWNFADGTVVSNHPYIAHAWQTPGDYLVVLTAYNESNAGGISVTQLIHVVESPVHYVAADSVNPVPPFSSWETAAKFIQEAINVAAVAGAQVVVTNGIYDQGGTLANGALSNRVAVTKPLVVRSVNGPDATRIRGYQVLVTTNGDNAMRCVYLTNSATLVGFTLENGATRSAGDAVQDQSGGGVWCESISALISNCVLVANSAHAWGGGGYRGTFLDCAFAGGTADSGGGAYGSALTHCVLTNNSANYGGAICAGVAIDCTLMRNVAWQGGAVYDGSSANCTIIGNSANRGGGAYSGNFSSCTIRSNSASSGGGTFNSSVMNSMLLENHADYQGGGCFASTLRGSAISANSSVAEGGGTHSGLLNNCTVTGNRAGGDGGGTWGSTLNNCIVYYNDGPPESQNYSSATINYSCTLPLHASGIGNISDEPNLASASHLSAASPCRGRGSADYSSGTDIDGELWSNPPSMGCDEYHSSVVTGALGVQINVLYSEVETGFDTQMTGLIIGGTSASSWDFGDGTVVSNRPYATHTWHTAGDYSVILTAYNESYLGGVSATQTMHVLPQSIHYVDPSSATPAAPFSSWTTAARTIQDAVDASLPGSTILVTNGLYSEGGAVTIGAQTNRVAVTKPLTVQSVNGPELTIIQGQQVLGTGYGEGAVRCAYLTNGATLIGFTLTNGATRAMGDLDREQSGGGAWCELGNIVISNCVIIASAASGQGGGAFRGHLRKCNLKGNRANSGGGSYGSDLIDCIVAGNSATSGGGTYGGTLSNCTLSGNNSVFGGGTYGANANNCVLTRNQAYYGGGGGAYGGRLNNCVLNRNSAYPTGGGAYGSVLNNCTIGVDNLEGDSVGAFGSTLNNCIVYNLIDFFIPAYKMFSNCTLSYCCVSPFLFDGQGNITNAPLFVDPANGDFHLQAQSPCINAGRNAYAPSGPELDGHPRMAGGTVDMGAYEFQNPGSTISYAWLQQFGLPTDGSADFADPDHDRFSNYQEWQAGTDPTNGVSVLKLLTPTLDGTNLVVSWLSVAGKYYVLECGTNVASSFVPVARDIPGQPGATSYTINNVTTGAGRGYFYRVGVQ